MNRFWLQLAAPLVCGILPMQAFAQDDDPYLWLEEVESERALEWVRALGAETRSTLEANPLFEPIFERNLEIRNSDERLPEPVQRGAYLYNFWRDAEHVRGIWRRTSVESFRSEQPDWETVIDLDRLAEDEGENWVWDGARCRYPSYDRCLVSLSRGGSDATVVREFDLKTQTFVADGFYLPEAKSSFSWRDRDSLFIGTDFGSGSLTDSGYPKDVRIWRRGTDLADAELVFAGAVADVSSRGFRMFDTAGYRDLIIQGTTFYTTQYFLYEDGGTIPLNLPADADLVDLIDDQLLVLLRTDWNRNGVVLPQGALVAVSVDALVSGDGDADVLFQPSARVSLESASRTRNTVLLNVLDNVVSRLEVVERRDGTWQRQALETPGPGSIGLVSTELESDRFYFSYTGFLSPPTIYEADAGQRSSELIKSQPAFFDATGMAVEQLSATSADGTRIPYFLVTPRGFEANGRNPTLLYGYGGFEIAMTPSYSSTVGTAWLERGGTYVVANIRGGGEFGPAWHQAALKGNRQRAFDDFIAVAEDLIERGITSPEHLGIQGGSNGGLLVGAVFVQRPDLFNAVVCQVPLLDMRRYHRLLAGASWMAEFGDPDKPGEWAYISAYSPYQNVSADADYPPVYFFTSTRDDRVHPGHARKMVARMLEQGHDVLYYENTEGGHGGAANLNQRALNDALAFAYLHSRLSSADSN